jgi:GNAT superfamily N-acetyltransferase
MRAQDIAAGMRLKALAGWNQTEEDWRFFLARGARAHRARREGCFVAVHDGVVIGTVTTTRYGPRLAWISMLLVDPAFRRQGIGTHLMQAAIDSVSDWPTIGLDATPAGRPLYERLGFRDEVGLVRTTVDCLPVDCLPFLPGPPPGVRPVESTDFDSMGDLDRAALGADRLPLLRTLGKRAPEAAWLSIRKGHVTGFCLGRHGSRFRQLGPVVAETLDEALVLSRAGLAAWHGQPALVDVPTCQGAFLDGLRGLGFALQRPFTRMTRGTRLSRPETAGHTFATCGPEYG